MISTKQGTNGGNTNGGAGNGGTNQNPNGATDLNVNVKTDSGIDVDAGVKDGTLNIFKLDILY